METLKTIISQPRYLPALNYLQRLYFADKFIILDVVQRQGRGWENRNKLLLPDPTWLSVPVASSTRALIADSLIDGRSWINEHKKKIAKHYIGAPYFNELLLNEAYALSNDSNRYLDILVSLIKNACRLLSFKPNLEFASNLLKPEDYQSGGPHVLRKLCERVDANCYVSGPNGRKYGVVDSFAGSKIEILFHEYQHPVYEQGGRPFIPYMGYLDALFYCGVDSLSNLVRSTPDLRGSND